MIKPPKAKRKRLSQKRLMTVCVAALAANFNALVCVADKAISYGDQIQWDSDATKIIKLNPSGSLLMFSGAETPTSKVLAGFIAVADQLGGKPRAETMNLCEQVYKEAVDELIQASFLAPRLLTKEKYLAALTAEKVNEYIRSLAEEIEAFEMDCDLLVCGFDQNKVPFILSVSPPGIVTDMTFTGFHAIGSGWDKAVSRLLFSEHKRDHIIARVLYDAFDAKANAEMAAGVGYEWDAVVSTAGITGTVDVSEKAKELIEKVWVKFNRSPFDTYDKKKDIEPPPRDWKDQLHALLAIEVLEKIEKARKAAS